jgi:hypothetical protein
MADQIVILLNLLWHPTVTQGTRSLAPLQPVDFNSMTNVFINITILLEHQSQVAKGVFLEYHVTIESNIPLLRGIAEIILHVLCFRPTKHKTVCL